MSTKNNDMRGIKQWREQEDKIILDPIQKARKNPRSLRFAINAKCYECAGLQRSEVKLCEIKDCALYNLRPWQPTRNEI